MSKPERTSAEMRLCQYVEDLQEVARKAADLCVCIPPGAVTGDALGRLATMSQLLHRMGLLEERHTFPRRSR